MSAAIIAALFIIKVFAGVAIGWATLKFYPVNDYWGFNRDGIVEYNLLLDDPYEFFTNIFRSPYQHGYTGFFDSIGSYWNDLRYNIILKLLAFCNIFSRGNFYINTLLFNFAGFFGPVALYRVFSHIYKNNKWAVLTGCFLLPSALFYGAGIHKELIVFTMLGLFSYAWYFAITQGFTLKRLLFILLTITCIFLIRNYVAVALIPVCAAFAICIKRKTNPLLTFLATYTFIFAAIIILQLLKPSFQPLKIITQKQADFLELPIANSQLNMKVLEPDLLSFFYNLPEAFDHGFLRPHFWDTKNSFLCILAIEILVYEILLLLVIFKYRKGFRQTHPFILFSIFFALSMLLITGYIIPNMGSIVRYRSIYLPFLLTPLLATFFRPTTKEF